MEDGIWKARELASAKFAQQVVVQMSGCVDRSMKTARRPRPSIPCAVIRTRRPAQIEARAQGCQARARGDCSYGDQTPHTPHPACCPMLL